MFCISYCLNKFSSVLGNFFLKSLSHSLIISSVTVDEQTIGNSSNLINTLNQKYGEQMTSNHYEAMDVTDVKRLSATLSASIISANESVD